MFLLKTTVVLWKFRMYTIEQDFPQLFSLAIIKIQKVTPNFLFNKNFFKSNLKESNFHIIASELKYLTLSQNVT